ncbi:hypothetical protein [Pedobacter sp. SYP-B3415]|uniref:hypothetical protein n=1 Tax=Pedobacter sp. SYP-B3415 TaxID=2496641 RepID=UPI00101BEA1C|nr:hypothetical protein [Pedobacter sp. SYP-B3415]
MSEHFPIYIPLGVPESADKLYELSSNVIQKLRNHKVGNEKFLKNVRLVLIEMATNFLKHVTDANASMLVTIEPGQLIICKTYTGSPIKFTCDEACFPFNNIGAEMRISFGKNNDHKIRIDGQYRFTFLHPVEAGPDIDLLAENYGLTIITLAADRFSYSYEPGQMKNEFLAVMRSSD